MAGSKERQPGINNPEQETGAAKKQVVIGVGTLGEGVVRTILEQSGQVLAIDIQTERLMNLTREDDLGELVTAMADFRETDKMIELLRGFGPVDRIFLTICPPRSHGGQHFWEEDRERLRDFWELNVVAMGLFIHAVTLKDSGVLAPNAEIVVLSSGDGLEAVPAPFEVAHAGEARFVAGLVDALQTELNNSERKVEGIKFLLAFPGPIIAESPDKDANKPLDPVLGGGEKATVVAKKILKALKAGKRHVITDMRVAAFATLEPLLSAILTRESLERFGYETKRKIIEETRKKRSAQSE